MEHNPVMTSTIIRDATNDVGKCGPESCELKSHVSMVKNEYFTTDQSTDYVPARTETTHSKKIQTTKDMLKLSGYSL